MDSEFSNSMPTIFASFEHLEELRIGPHETLSGLNRVMKSGSHKRCEDLRFGRLFAFRGIATDLHQFSWQSIEVANQKLPPIGQLQLTDHLRGEKGLYYGHLVGYLDNYTPNQIELNDWRFPVDFFGKFLNIRSVWVHHRVEERFLWFLSRCTRLNYPLKENS